MKSILLTLALMIVGALSTPLLNADADANTNANANANTNANTDANTDANANACADINTDARVDIDTKIDVATQSTTNQDPQRAVLVTGASSGIGRQTAELLAKSGFYIYAGARKEKDLKELSAIDNIQGIRLDVTKPEEIAAAVKTVQAAGRGLYGLINNAGVVELAPLIEIPEADMQFIFDVNVFGPYRVTKAFAPLIIESKGRISTTGSLSGFAVWGLGGPYCMTKHAVEAYTEALAAEMAQFGVKVSVVEPGNYKSKITTSMKKRLDAKGYSTENSRYKSMLDGVLSSSLDRAQYKDPSEVADAFLHALTSDSPKLRYLVVPNQGEAKITIRAALQKVAQLNARHEYSYSRGDLVEMLDKALGDLEE